MPIIMTLESEVQWHPLNRDAYKRMQLHGKVQCERYGPLISTAHSEQEWPAVVIFLAP